MSAPAGRVLSMSIRGRKSPGMRHCVTGNHQPNDITVRTLDLTDFKRLAGILLLTAFWYQGYCYWQRFGIRDTATDSVLGSTGFMFFSSWARGQQQRKMLVLWWYSDILGALESANTWHNLKRLYRIFVIVGLLATAHAAATLQPMMTFTQQHSVQQ
jgi:hypothetical protein